MSRRNARSNNGRLDLKLNQSEQGGSGRGGGVRQAAEASPATSPATSPARSCVSSEESLKYSSSPETTSMVLVGCPRCLMYVMLSEVDPRCPQCKSTVLLDLHQNSDESAAGNRRRN